MDGNGVFLFVCFFTMVSRLLVLKRVTIRVLHSALRSEPVCLRLLSAARLISGTPTPQQAEGPKSGKHRIFSKALRRIS